MSIAIGQYSQNPEITARSLFFSELKQLAPEVIEDLRKSAFDLRDKICRLVAGRGIKLDEELENQPVEMKHTLRNMLLNSGYLEDDLYKELQSKYDKSIEDWACRWNMGKEKWLRESDWIVGKAKAEIDTFIDPSIKNVFSQYDIMGRFLASLTMFRSGTAQTSREQLRQIYSPTEMQKMYGPEWRKVVERDGEAWEETVESMSMPTAEENPALFQKLFDRLTKMLPNRLIIPVPGDSDFIYANPGWDPTIESRTDAAKRIRADFEEYLSVYLACKEAQTKEGLQHLPESLLRRPNKDRLRFEWLIRFQTQVWSKNKIAERYGVDRKAVRESLRKEAELIGLRLRDQIADAASPVPEVS
jgi:hypothetical protein